MPLRFYGVEVGTRTTVCRLAGGGLWPRSPVRLTEKLRGSLGRLGTVRYVIAPDKLHHRFAGDYLTAYPEARAYAAPGLAKRRRDLPFHGVLGDAPEPGRAEDLDQSAFHGERQLEEVVLLHRASRTLILADLVRSGHPGSPRSTRFATRLKGTYERPGPPAPVRLGFRDGEAARTYLERVLSWDFERIVMARGRIVETGGKAVLERAYSSLAREAGRTRGQKGKREERP